jgi:hypothetical protein
MFKAKDETDAKRIAENSFLVIQSITLEPPKPASLYQKNLALSLKLSFPEDITMNELHHLIQKKTEKEYDAPQWLIDYLMSLLPEEVGLGLTQYIGIESAFSLLINHLKSENNSRALIKLLALAIINDKKRLNWSLPLNEIADEEIIEKIAETLSQNSETIKSLMRLSISQIIWLRNVYDSQFKNDTKVSPYNIACNNIIKLLFEYNIITKRNKLKKGVNKEDLKTMNIY